MSIFKIITKSNNINNYNNNPIRKIMTIDSRTQLAPVSSAISCRNDIIAGEALAAGTSAPNDIAGLTNFVPIYM